MQYKAGELSNELRLFVMFFAHFLLELLDGVAIKVVNKEVEVELI
mgnify:CR=1 FL=1